MVNVVFHGILVEKSLQPRARAVEAVIKNLYATDSNVITWGYEGENVEIANLFQAGDTVVLYGAFKEACLRNAYEALTKKGVFVSYHSEGCL